MNMRVLVYNNRTKVAERMEPLFAAEGLDMVVAGDVPELEKYLAAGQVQLMLVDVELQDKGWDKGIEMIVRLRRESRIPFLVISTQASETAKIMALEAGADDYVTAECNPMELMARIKSQLRRYLQLSGSGTGNKRIYEVGGLVVDDSDRKVTVDGRNVRLTPIEYKILRLLVQQRGKVLSNCEIYENIWQMQPIGADNTIAVHVRHIREKIESDPRDPRYLKVVWGTGYKVG
jgi:DNA-binding response OmpR family regulator